MPIFASFSTHFAKTAKIDRGSNLANRAGFLLAGSKKLQAVNEMHATFCDDASAPPMGNSSITPSNILRLEVTAITPAWVEFADSPCAGGIICTQVASKCARRPDFAYLCAPGLAVPLPPTPTSISVTAMPLYEFRCTGCGPLERSFAMAEVPSSIVCPQCSADSRRVMSTPRLSHASSVAMGLLDATARSAHEPAVVNGSLPGTRRTVTPTTSNPLHRKLPRP